MWFRIHGLAFRKSEMVSSACQAVIWDLIQGFASVLIKARFRGKNFCLLASRMTVTTAISLLVQKHWGVGGRIPMYTEFGLCRQLPYSLWCGLTSEMQSSLMATSWARDPLSEEMLYLGVMKASQR